MYPWEKDVYGPEDYDDFTSRFGRSLDDAPVLFPAFNNYYQDISGGGSFLGNLTKMDGVKLFSPGQNPSYPDLKWKWYINGVLVSELANPKLSDLKHGCDGVVKIKLWVSHLPTGVIYEREEWGYLDYNDVESCPPDPTAPSQFEVFIPFYPDVDPKVEYGIMPWDLTGDKKVTTADLNKFLAKYQP